MSAGTPDYVRLNRDIWTKSNARYTDGRAEEAWAQAEIAWGVWQTPESVVNVLPDVTGKDVVELGGGLFRHDGIIVQYTGWRRQATKPRSDRLRPARAPRLPTAA